MKLRTGTILLIGFGSLVALIGVLGFGGFRRAERIYHEVAAIHEAYRQTASMLSDIESITTSQAFSSETISWTRLRKPPQSTGKSCSKSARRWRNTSHL